MRCPSPSPSLPLSLSLALSFSISLALSFSLLLALSVLALLPVHAQDAATLKVFGAYATPIEEPWDGVIHAALTKAQEDGLIEYEYQDDIGYSGDMEVVLREVAEEKQPAVIFGDAFGNEEAVRKVAKDYPDIAFVFGSGGLATSWAGAL